MKTQLSFLPKPTVAQYVYAVWLEYYRSEKYKDAHPMAILAATVRDINLPLDLTMRIIGTQSRWNARKALRSALK
jgi:hypothetical protein